MCKLTLKSKTKKAKYPDYIKQLEKVIKPEYSAAIKKLKELDPHDLVRPEHYFNSEAKAVGVVFRRFAMQMKSCIFG